MARRGLDRRSIAALIASLAAVVVLGGACSATRASTTYETFSYTVSIPNDIGLQALNDDPGFLWANPGTAFVAKTTDIALSFELSAFPACERGTILAFAQQVQSAISMTNSVEPVEKTWAGNPGAILSGDAAGRPSAIGFVCHGGTVAEALGFGVGKADLELVMESFRFRDPAGDPRQPPSAKP